MLKSILKYQKSFQKLINDLKVNKKVLAIFAFGSIVSGDLWDESDIDLFVLYKDKSGNSYGPSKIAVYNLGIYNIFKAPLKMLDLLGIKVASAFFYSSMPVIRFINKKYFENHYIKKKKLKPKEKPF